MIEEWRDIPGYDGDYKVSSSGRVRSYKSGSCRELSLCLNRQRGYLYVALCRGGKLKNHTVHSLVLLAFVGPRPEGFECCHNDGNRTNNALSNLRWDTKKANQADKTAHNTALIGYDSPMSKLSKEDCAAILSAIASGAPPSRLAVEYEVDPETVRRLLTGQCYKNVDRNGMTRPPRGTFQVKGESHHSNKVTREQAMDIKIRALRGDPLKEVAALYNVSPSLVSKIKRGVKWKELGDCGSWSSETTSDKEVVAGVVSG